MTLAVTHLVDRVEASMIDAGVVLPHAFGWREPARRDGQSRIVYVPGDDGLLGEVLPARYPGRSPRPLATIDELVTVYLEGKDAAAPENERAQYTATRLLLDSWLAAVRRTCPGWAYVRECRWVDDKNLRRHGSTIRAVLVVEAMVPDLEPVTIMAGEGTSGGPAVDRAHVTTELWEPPTILAETTTLEAP